MPKVSQAQVRAVCRACNTEQTCVMVGKEPICLFCRDKYNYIRTLVIEATPLESLPTGVW